MVQVTAGESAQVLCRWLANLKSGSPVGRGIRKGGSGGVWYNLNTMESIAEGITSLVLLQQKDSVKNIYGKGKLAHTEQGICTGPGTP